MMRKIIYECTKINLSRRNKIDSVKTIDNYDKAATYHKMIICRINII